MTPEVEEWRPVVGYEGCYEVSNQGRVRSVERVVRAGQRGGVRVVPSVELRLSVGSSGYPQITLQRRTFTVHELVARAFLGERPESYEVCHNNGDSTDNCLANLRYDTISENRLDTVRHGRNRQRQKTHCPQNHPYDETNTGFHRGARRCLTCHRERERARQRKAS